MGEDDDSPLLQAVSVVVRAPAALASLETPVDANLQTTSHSAITDLQLVTCRKGH